MSGELPKICVFDLDGTLVDSLRDIAESLNECLALLGQPTHPIDAYRFMVGEGIPKLCGRAVGARAPHLAPRLTELARARYYTRPLRHSAPYPGVRALVDRLRDAGVRLAVLSNKPHEATVRMVEALWPTGTFERVEGYKLEALRKPDPRMLLSICAELGASPERCWMIGDTHTDVATARAAGCVAVGVTWGFRPRQELASAGADRIVDHPDELP